MDENPVFYKFCKNIDQKTYKIILWSYGKDKSNIYYGCDKVPVKDSKTFEILNTSKFWIYYAKDKYNIYLWKDIISDDPQSFKFLWNENPRFAFDKNNLYCR